MFKSKITNRSLKVSALTMSLLGLVACGGGSSSGGSKSSASSEASSSVVVSSSSSSSVPNEGLTLLRTDGNKWVKASGNKVDLKGTNLGNWLVQEFWMMGQGGNGVHDQCTLEAKLTERFGYSEKERLIKLFRDSWMTERDWDQLQAFGFNIVRLPILWSVIEDEKNPKTLRTDAWHYIDMTIAEAKKRGMYVILDLHGAPGGQTPNDHTGCSGQNKYWTNTEYQDRTKWLWEQIATKYKDEPAVAAYDPLNEPWGSTAENMEVRVTELYNTIRKIDSKHIVILHSHYGNIEIYGDPVAKGMTNVAFELHPYPGFFDDRPKDARYDVHRDWLRCGASGTGGVCDWNRKITALKTPLLMGEFQPWQAAGLELGGKIGRATYDTYASYNWAATSWAYKVVSPAGGQGEGTWGMVTNAINSNNDTGVGLVAKASTWDCAKWNSSFADACAKKATSIKVGGTGPKTYYFVIKTGANAGANPDVTYDKISIVNDATKAEVIKNGNFGASTDWTTLTIKGTENLDFNYSDAGKLPVGSDGAVLRITRPNGVTGEINGGIYQAITLEGGQSYTFSGTFRDNGSVDTWAEMYLIDQVPVDGNDVLDMTGKVDFTTAPLADIEKLFKSFATQPYDVHSGLAKYLTSKTAPTIFTLPNRPTGLTLEQGTGSVTLSWDENAEGDVTGYNVYRGLAPTSGTLLAKDVKLNSYVDSTAVDGTTYYYTVTAVDAEDESYRSDEAANKISFVALPGKIEAEAYTSMSGIQLEDCSDTGGGKDVGHFETDDFIEFKVSVATAGNFTIDYRLATAAGSTGFEVLIDDVKVDSRDVPNTGGWQNWQTFTSPSFALTAGNHTLRFNSLGKEWNINYFEVNAAK